MVRSPQKKYPDKIELKLLFGKSLFFCEITYILTRRNAHNYNRKNLYLCN